MNGHIAKKGKTWYVVVDVPGGVKRRQRWVKAGPKKDDAQHLRVELLHAINSGIDLPFNRIATAEFLAKWLDAVRGSLAPKTHHRYWELLTLHVTPAIGAVQLDKVRPLHVQQVYAKMQESGLSARTVVQCGRVLHKAFRDAIRWQMLRANPADGAILPTIVEYEIPEMSVEQISRLLEAASAFPAPFGAMVHVALLTGMRLAEISGLRWADVDFDNAVIGVRQTCQWLPRQGFIFKAPKTRASKRAIGVTQTCIGVLRQERTRQLENRLRVGEAYKVELDLVFCGPLGDPVSPNTFRGVWVRISSAAGVHWRFHDLRHAHASLMLRAGVALKVVSARLGHSSVAITGDVYSHVAADLQSDAAARLDRVLEKR
jgi:integrase